MTQSRHRVQDSRSETTIGYSGTDSNGTPFAGIVSTGNYEGEQRTMDDVSNPGFRQRSKMGQIIMSPCSRVAWSREYSAGSMTDTGTVPSDSKYSNSIWGDFCSCVESPVPAPSSYLESGVQSMIQIALAKAYAKMNSPTILGGEILHDLNQTVGMLRRPFGSSRDLLQRMLKYRKRRIGKTSASAAKASANAWLEYRYGWKPIILDANAIIKDAHVFREKMSRQRLVARCEEQGVTNVTHDFSRVALGGALTSWLASGSVSRTFSARACVGVMYDLADRTTTQRLNEMLGSRTQDLPSTLWEVIPYSFVADWFLNVGDWLQAITPNPYVTVRSSWATTVCDSVTEWSGAAIIPSYPGHPSDQYGNLGSSKIHSYTYIRTVDPVLSFTPTLTVKPLSMLHSADAVSLLVKPIVGLLNVLRH